MNTYGHIIWILFGALIGFLASFIFGDLLSLPLDLYYFTYFVLISIFFVVYVRKSRLNLKKWFSRRLRWGVVLGLIFAAVMAQNVLSRPATETFTGAYLVWLILWRGVVYGTIDGLLLTVFPWIVTWRAFGAEGKPLGKKVAFGLLSWLFILVTTSAYHAGYSDFRSTRIIQANMGNSIMCIPTLISANPVATTIAHAALHITAVIHCPETELFLPPHRE